MAVANLDISTWQGISIGAVHWYAKLIVEDEKERYGSKDIRLERPLLAEEVKAMNLELKRQGYPGIRHRMGDMTEGFNTEEEAIALGIKTFRENYTGVLYLGDSACCSAWKNILVHRPEHKVIAEKMNKIAKEFQSLNGYEGKQRERVEKLDDAWQKLYFKLNKLCTDK